ncbi:Na+/H+ antiporter subunit E [Agilicoccus flavus]|uniref:Na+/H+ antiporter subunit E n=1 Tax=Agilicoccus flavus TaxID=2775968 RepID=UPI001CF64E4A|nr:Na+/H+ antiporter subunit E [Agilicoccus flavus]
MSSADTSRGTPRRRARPASGRVRPLPLLLLTAVWVLLWGNLSVGNVVAGLLVGLVVLVLFPLPYAEFRTRVRPIALLVLLGRFLFDLVTASLVMAYQAAAPWVRPQGRLMTVPLRTHDEVLATLTAEMTGLIPGSIIVDLDVDRREMLIHAFDVPDQEAFDRVMATVQGQEDRVLRAFVTPDAESAARPTDAGADPPANTATDPDPDRRSDADADAAPGADPDTTGRAR